MAREISIFQKGSKEYKLLESAAALLTAKSPNSYNYCVGETYFDYGQNWKWTTILCDNGERGYQALCPVEQEMILNGEIEAAVKRVFEDKYCPDKIREEVR